MRDARRNLCVRCAMFVATVLLTGACSGDEDAADATTTAPTAATDPATNVVPTTDVAGSVSIATEAPAKTAAPTADVAPTAPTASTAPPTVPTADTGVPGLDSDDAFCAAWSRFGGSWQVVLAAAAFGDPDEAARLEVIASTVAGDAYESIFEVWPDELAGEQDIVADQYFGAFQRRSADAFVALEAAGATAADVEQLAVAWVDALATRNPADPELAVELPDDLAALADEAGEAFAAARVPLTSDPSMIITASTPLTDAYLATACPDQGSITGQDIIDG